MFVAFWIFARIDDDDDIYIYIYIVPQSCCVRPVAVVRPLSVRLRLSRRRRPSSVRLLRRDFWMGYYDREVIWWRGGELFFGTKGFGMGI